MVLGLVTTVVYSDGIVKTGVTQDHRILSAALTRAVEVAALRRRFSTGGERRPSKDAEQRRMRTR